MSKTAIFTTPAVVEWVKLFPRQVTETHTSSVTFMKQLTTIALGTILHTKNLFPADCFLVEKFCGMEVTSLKKNCTHEMAQFISEALVQAFDAFDKKYLDQLVICFYEGDCSADNILEYYVFQYTYNKEGGGVAVNVRRPHDPQDAPPTTKFTFDHVRHKTEKMIQTCVLLVTQFGRRLPDNYDVSLRLYYNEHAPAGYQAPGYEDGLHEPDHLAATLHEALHLGSVGTPYHHLDTHLYIREDVASSREAIATQNPPLVSQMERDSFRDSGQAAVSDVMDSRMSTSEECRIQCPCLLDVIDEEADDAILICQYCGVGVHAVCHGVLRGGGGPGDGGPRAGPCCVRCWEQQPARPGADRRLTSLQPHNRQVKMLCMFRRVLLWCVRAGHVSARRLVRDVRVSSEHAPRYMRLLHSYGLVQQLTLDDKTPLPIVHDQLTKVMPRFFNNQPHIVDRLLAETKPRDSPHNLVDEILTPIEKVDLQRDTVVGEVVKPEQSRDIDDTLTEYREAIIMLNTRESTELPPFSADQMGVDRNRAGKRRLDAPRGTGVGTKRRRSTDSTCRKLL